MNMLINHCWCQDSIWGGMYDCQSIVSINMVPEGKSYHDSHDPDWVNLIEKHEFEGKDEAGHPYYTTQRLKSDVIQWLTDNIEKCMADNRAGWAIGTDAYNANNQLSFPIFFERPRDALKFIRRWSVYRNPIDYLNYFQDIRRKFNHTTKQMNRVKKYE